MNSYESFVRQFANLVRQGRELPLGGFPPPQHRPILENAPRVLIFSPHPDDEVIIGALPLRLRKESGWRVVNVAVTQGSNRGRRAARWTELEKCCAQIGFELIAAAEGGLDGVTLKAREARPGEWANSVEQVRRILETQRPRAVLFPHDDDWNQTHIGTHHLVVDALRAMGSAFECFAVETEFWGAMDTPNLMVESSEEDVAELLTALSFHEGEVRRNPYHVRMPGWLIDNVRRGGELVGGQGGAAPDFVFGTLYRLRRWRDGGFHDALKSGRFVSLAEPVPGLFA